MQAVKITTADRLAEAAINLMDAARAASAESPHYAPGKAMLAETVALAVQAVFLADRWGEGAGKLISVQRSETLTRVRGLGMGCGAAIGGIDSDEGQSESVAAFAKAMTSQLAQRRASQGRGPGR